MISGQRKSITALLLVAWLAASCPALSQESDEDTPNNGGSDKQEQTASETQAAAPPPYASAELSSEKSSDSNRNKDQDDNSNAEQRTQTVAWDWWFAAILVVCSIAQATVGVWQWRVMQENIRQTQEGLELTRLGQRAWLHTSASAGPAGKPLHNLDWKVTVHNSGSSPATITYSEITLIPNERYNRMRAKSDDALRNMLEESARKSHKRSTVIGPNAQHTFGLQDINRAWAVAVDPEQRRKTIEFSRLAAIFIYEDIWGEEHVTVCCYMQMDGKFISHYEDGHMD